MKAYELRTLIRVEKYPSGWYLSSIKALELK
jgi:hypothetical protein